MEVTLFYHLELLKFRTQPWAWSTESYQGLEISQSLSWPCLPSTAYLVDDTFTTNPCRQSQLKSNHPQPPLLLLCYCSACFIASHIHVDISIFIPQRERETQWPRTRMLRRGDEWWFSCRLQLSPRVGLFMAENYCVPMSHVMPRSIFRTPLMFAIKIMFALLRWHEFSLWFSSEIFSSSHHPPEAWYMIAPSLIGLKYLSFRDALPACVTIAFAVAHANSIFRLCRNKLNNKPGSEWDFFARELFR